MDYDLYLFLDFDGVLHEDPAEFLVEIKEPFVHVPEFEKWLRQADPNSRVGIVISSMWRKEENLEQLKAHFSPHVAEQIIGVTPDLPIPSMGWGGTDSRGHRQTEIEIWMAHNAPGASWIALDDRKDGFKIPNDRLVLCTPYDEDGRGLDEYSLRALFWAIKDKIDVPLEEKKSARFRPS